MVSADRLDWSISLSCADSAGSVQKNTNGVRFLLFVYDVFTICLRQLLDCAALRAQLPNTENGSTASNRAMMRRCGYRGVVSLLLVARNHTTSQAAYLAPPCPVSGRVGSW